MATLKDKQDALLQATEKKTGLILTRIQTSGQLEQMLAAGLADLYQQVFGGPPYNEQFTKDEVCDIFRNFLNEGGRIFTATDPSLAGKPVAFVVSVPLAVDFNVAAAVKGKVRVDNTAYFAEDGVSETLRRRGISGSMKQLLLDSCGIDGFSRVLLRTSVENYQQISAVNKAGGRVVKDVVQDVPRLRKDGSTTIDKNAFYLFDLKKTGVAESFNRVVIARAGGIDRAVVFDAVKKADQKKIARKIRAVYPNIADISFGQKKPAGDVLFDGRLYCMKPARRRGII